MSKYKYLFSLIVPVYNTEKYLEECIESVVNQTIGFENIQLILINDGSQQQGDEDICLKYKNKYPNNIIYEKKEKGGVSSSRNAGYKYLQGEYVTFLDADDKFVADTFEKVYNYFEEHYNEINLVSIPAYHFDKYSTKLGRYNGFDKTEIKDIFYGNQIDHRTIWSYFYKNELIKKYYSDINSLISNDTKVIVTILLNERKYGYLPTTKYLWRVRKDDSSETSIVSKDILYIDYIHKKLIQDILVYFVNLSIALYGEVIHYSKQALLYSLAFIISKNKQSHIYLKVEEKIKFLKDLHFIIQFIDDENILIKELSFYRLFLLQFKYKEFDYYRSNKIDINFFKDKSNFNNDAIDIIELLKPNTIKIEKVNNNLGQDILNLALITNIPLGIQNLKIYAKVDNLYFYPTIYSENLITIWEEDIFTQYTIFLNLDFDSYNNKNLEFYLDLDGMLINQSIKLEVK